MRRQAFKLLFAGMASLLLVPGFAQSIGFQSLSLDTVSHSRAALSGPWEMYWGGLLQPGDFSRNTSHEMVDMPALWQANLDTGAVGFATYRLSFSVQTPFDKRELALVMPDTYSTYRIWIDGKEYPGNGTIGTDAKSTSPYWEPKVIAFKPTSDTVEVVLQIANFHHSKGGMSKTIYAGLADQTVAFFEKGKTGNLILFIVLLMIAAIVGSIYFVVQEKSLAMIFYICLCLSWALRVAFSNLYIGVEWFPQLAWIWVVRLEYISLYLTMIFGMLFIAYIFPEDVSNAFKIMYILFGTLFTGFTLFTQPMVFTKFVQLYLAFSALLLMAILVTIVKAQINGRAGATLFLLNMVFGVGMFGYVILDYQKVLELNEMVFSIGFGILFLTTGIAMGVRLMRSAKAHDSDMLTFEQMFGKS